ncbi:Atg21p NDAI_0E02630 [Naumovozyma dairenensis CBS 421]|uniref:Autophagy-related protein 21 n=1 Tax=Naumovozyma dairenensis (strain ATCC 10597 / BCRC 20456 / CBS 421 / NBRC 0211 / NRRL Y-12639) TaxID=1071378 RepID=G0WBG0_NAUDC|nr:hypothetical protein NDAI_0E02630 [Naumovozyma dairenensis CBS 421]CCD25080.1 hypothetical protein NDAI_0E02630 [Naumovozyma dairenensis CBS 421]
MKVLNFNQDATCCVVYTAPHIVSIYNCDPFGKCFELDSRLKSTNTNKHADNANNSMDGSNTSGNLRDEEVENEIIEESLTNLSNNNNNLTSMDDSVVVEMLFSTSLVAIADRSQSSIKSKRLKIVNTKRKSTICEISFSHAIVDVVMNRKRMCILLESDQIFVYDISCMKPLETIDLWEDHIKNNTAAAGIVSNIRETSDPKSHTQRKRRNSLRSRLRPRMVLSNDDRSILCYTSYSSTKNQSDSFVLNDIVVYDALNVTPLNYLNSVHKGNIACLAINYDGKLIATGSDKGTIIRIYSTGVDCEFNASKALKYEFRRGSRTCNLYQLSFDRKSSMLGCVGDTDTIHIFKLDPESSDEFPGLNSQEEQLLDQNDEIQKHTNGDDKKFVRDPSKQLSHFFSKRIKASIPNQNLRRDYAHISMNESLRYCLGFPGEFPNQVYVASDDGTFKVYSLPSTPGECILMKTSKFD